MKICPKCSNQHDKNGTFCSRACANSRVFSDEAKLKKSIALKGKLTGSRTENFNLDSWREKTKATRLLKYQSTSFDELGMTNKRRRVLEEQTHACNRCGLSHWLDVPITLELEHKDGNTGNNTRDNLEALCPNCHSVTETWRGRNKPSKNGINDVSDNFLLECLLSTKNIRQGLLKAGLAAKGKNYERAKTLLISLL